MPRVTSQTAFHGPRLSTCTQVHMLFVMLQKRQIMTDLVCSKLGGSDHAHEAAMARH